jgi:hypothetical protein
MGWGISFGLNEQGRVYCSDGCNWSASAADYADYPKWPSAARAVLDYFEEECHQELDMIRDECPGTAAALKEACAEHISYALSAYDQLSDAKKTELHLASLEEYAAKADAYQRSLTTALADYRAVKENWKAFKKNVPSKRRSPRSRAEEIEREIEPLQLELELERAATHVDNLRKSKATAVRMLNREKKFSL